MKTISVKKAIEAQTWFECHGKNLNEELVFRLRIVAFDPFLLAGIDHSALKALGDDGLVWRMEIEVVNLRKTPFKAGMVGRCIVLVDEDGFQFGVISELDPDKIDPNKTSRLHRFSERGIMPPLFPKIKAFGAILFRVPDQESNYYLTIKDGTIREA